MVRTWTWYMVKGKQRSANIRGSGGRERGKSALTVTSHTARSHIRHEASRHHEARESPLCALVRLVALLKAVGHLPGFWVGASPTCRVSWGPRPVRRSRDGQAQWHLVVPPTPRGGKPSRPALVRISVPVSASGLFRRRPGSRGGHDCDRNLQVRREGPFAPSTPSPSPAFPAPREWQCGSLPTRRPVYRSAETCPHASSSCCVRRLRRLHRSLSPLCAGATGSVAGSCRSE